MQKVKIMDGPHAGATIEVSEPVPAVIQVRAILKEPVWPACPMSLRKDLRLDRSYEYRVEFFVEDLKLSKGEWRAFLE